MTRRDGAELRNMSSAGGEARHLCRVLPARSPSAFSLSLSLILVSVGVSRAASRSHVLFAFGRHGVCVCEFTRNPNGYFSAARFSHMAR